MTGYSKWDRDAYVARVGGEEEADRRHRETMARVDGYELSQIRKTLGRTQEDVAEVMGVSKSRVSQIERGEVFTVEVVGRYIAALGGELRLLADFGNLSYRVSGERRRAA